MAMPPLIAAVDLIARLRGPTPPVLLDCGFDLFDPAAGECRYLQGHLPGAHYLHLERDLSGPKHGADGRFRGRHPLPERDAWAAAVGRLGVAPGVPVVAYDGQGGPYAARAWWLLRWLGHADVAVLDGGIDAFVAAGGTLADDVPPAPGGTPYPSSLAAMPTIDADMLLERLGAVCVLDARAGERFRGETEPLDPVAGHIPGALNRNFKDNLQANGRFKSAAALRADLEPLVANHKPGDVVQQCGSGVTACHNLLALEVAGLGTTVLYPGSWSDWCADARRPVALG